MPFPVPSANTIRVIATGSTVAAIAIATPFIADKEGYLSTAKHDPIDPPGVITVCNGITNYDLPGLKPGMKFTKDRCDDLLRDAMPRYAAPIDKCVTAEISNHTRAALYSGSYNLGPATVCKSSMVRKINRGDLQGGCDAFLLYTLANGQHVPGLLNRRKAERILCLTPDAPIPAPTPAPVPPKVEPKVEPKPEPAKPTFWQRVKSWIKGWFS